MNSFHISLTGHHPHTVGGYDMSAPIWVNLQAKLKQILLDNLQTHDHITAHSGLALGADTVWANAILTVKAKFPDRISFVAEVPCPTQYSRWREESKEVWLHLVSEADIRNVYSDVYIPSCMQDRNIGMVNAADLLIAFWNGNPRGGTANAVRYAQSKRKPILKIDPMSV